MSRASTFVTVLALVALVVLACVACGEEPPAQFPLAKPTAPGTCESWTGQPVDRSCIPRMARSGRPLQLEIEERCGVCGTTAERCTVMVQGYVIAFSLDGKTCEPPAGTSCSEVCGKNRVRCAIPPLEEGRYEVHYGDTSRRVDTFDVVNREDAMTACTLEDLTLSAPLSP